MKEKRKFVRIPENSQIYYKLVSEKNYQASLTKDISQGGIRFFIHEFIPKNSLLEIKIILGKILFTFEALVKVKWIDKEAHGERYEVGAEFVNILEEAKERLTDYINDILTRK